MSLIDQSFAVRQFAGIGMYPTNEDGSANPCYDADRASWLPYWIDNSTESACKYNSPSLIGQMGGVVGSAAGAVLSGAADAAGSAASNALSNSSSGGLILGIAGAALLFMLLKR